MRQTLDRVQVSYWFVPLVASILAMLLACLTMWLDARVLNLPPGPFGLFSGSSPAVVRTALIGMAATILTTTGVVYSLLTVPLSVAASQYGSRLLRVYLKDRTTQTVLGIFVGAAVYCLSLGLLVSGNDSRLETPQISIGLGLLVTLAAYASLIALIHRIGVFLQAPNVVAAASQELRAVIRSYAPGGADQPVGTVDPSESGKSVDSLLNRVEEEGKPIYAYRLGISATSTRTWRTCFRSIRTWSCILCASPAISSTQAT
jgi:uncharacterized membrane protein